MEYSINLITDSTLSLKEEKENFKKLQQHFLENYAEIFYNDLAEKTVLIIPSLTLDEEILKTIKGVVHYEERMLCMLMLLRMPRTHIVFVTSVPIDNSIIDYYLHLLPGITGYHARQRLTLLSCYDASRLSLTEKILKRPRLINRILSHIKNPKLSHISCFNVTEYERKLANTLGLPLYGCDPDLFFWGTKSGSREIFNKAGITMPHGFNNLGNKNDVISALARLKQDIPEAKKAVIKMNDGFSGEGNAIFYYDDIDAGDLNIHQAIIQKMNNALKIVAKNVDINLYFQKFESMGGIVEEFIDGEIKTSPSVQCRINPEGSTEIISTHDQELGGESGQVFIGASFPANKEYSHEIAFLAKKISDELFRLGILGRFAVDFLSVKQKGIWKHYAIELNIRKGGTTHPFMMLQFLTEGEYIWNEGEFLMPNGQKRYYFATDNVVNEKYIGLTPHDLIDIAMCNHLQYDGAKQEGVMFHIIGALSQYGKLGMVCIGKTPEEAKNYYYITLKVLDKECP